MLEVNEAMGTLVGRARSAGGEVSVTVAATGAVTGLELNDAALRRRASELSALILTTIADAAADASRRTQDILAPLVGESSAAALLGARLTPATVQELREQLDATGGPR